MELLLFNRRHIISNRLTNSIYYLMSSRYTEFCIPMYSCALIIDVTMTDELKLRVALKLVFVVPAQGLIRKVADRTSSAAVHNFVSLN
jgi:hypothetical protein